MTAIGDKTKPRGRRAVDAIHAKGPSFHALAEFNVGALVEGEARRAGPPRAGSSGSRMASAGYDPARDTWAINELSSAARTKPITQSRMRGRDARALHRARAAPRRSRAPSSSSASVSSSSTSARTSPRVETGSANSGWWTSVSPYVAWWGQEAYASCSKDCVCGAKIAIRSTHLNEYVEHPARLAFAGPAPAVPARALFDRAYLPLMTAYWRDAKGYGNNRVSLAHMQALTSLEVYAARAWAIRNPYPDGRIGFAWNEHPAGATPAQVQALATRVAQSIAGAYGDGGTAARACGPTGAYTWCKATLGGARFNPGWATFASW